jgi:diadenosine tetraphosphate (Ap4A) HIT family hydrolase
MTRGAGCPLCEADGGVLVARTAKLRVIRADEDAARFPAFYRVVWNEHVPELSQLSPEDRQHCMDAVVLVEEALRRQLKPHKVNLAALGNAVPHLHWHVIGRYPWDSHFPAPVWAAPQREVAADRIQGLAALLPALESGLADALRRLGDGHRAA